MERDEDKEKRDIFAWATILGIYAAVLVVIDVSYFNWSKPTTVIIAVTASVAGIFHGIGFFKFRDPLSLVYAVLWFFGGVYYFLMAAVIP